MYIIKSFWAFICSFRKDDWFYFYIQMLRVIQSSRKSNTCIESVVVLETVKHVSLCLQSCEVFTLIRDDYGCV